MDRAETSLPKWQREAHQIRAWSLRKTETKPRRAMNYSDQGFRFAGLVYKHIVSIWESGFHISELVLSSRNSSIKEREFQIVGGTNTRAVSFQPMSAQRFVGDYNLYCTVWLWTTMEGKLVRNKYSPVTVRPYLLSICIWLWQIPSLKYQVWWTGFFSQFELDFYCLCT